jgi:hypothetical protein
MFMQENYWRSSAYITQCSAHRPTPKISPATPALAPSSKSCWFQSRALPRGSGVQTRSPPHSLLPTTPTRAPSNKGLSCSTHASPYRQCSAVQPKSFSLGPMVFSSHTCHKILHQGSLACHALSHIPCCAIQTSYPSLDKGLWCLCENPSQDLLPGMPGVQLCPLP